MLIGGGSLLFNSSVICAVSCKCQMVAFLQDDVAEKTQVSSPKRIVSTKSLHVVVPQEVRTSSCFGEC